MSFSSDDTKERVKEAIDIVDLVGRYVQLRRQGRGFVALCPWHDDSRPSLQVNPERQSFKCWVCDIGGDVFSFVMRMEGVDFREALAMLADQAGIDLKRRGQGEGNSGQGTADGRQATGESGEGRGRRIEGKRTLYQAMAWAEQKYHECLVSSPEAEHARRYLQERRITDESIVKFHLGFSPNRGDWLVGLAEEAKANVGVLETVGILARPAAGGNFYDRFRGRLLFSIRDPQGRPIGFGGRVLPESGSTSPAKYINSPETPLFRKSKTLYGLDLAKQSLRKDRTVVVMEGYTDCIVAHQHGFDGSVAVLGTALGDDHIRTLAPYADRIVLVLDGDEAGQRRANEVLGLFVAKEVDLRIATLPEGADPADFLAEHGREAFADLLASRALDAFEHAYQANTRGLDLASDIHSATQAMERMLAVVARAPRLTAQTTQDSRLRQGKILERLAFKFRVPEEDVRNRLTALRRKAARRPAPVRSSSFGRSLPPEGGTTNTVSPSPDEPPIEASALAPIDPWQRELLEILVRHPECLEAARSGISTDKLANAACRRVYETGCRLADDGIEPTFDRLMLELDEEAPKSLLVELDENASAKGIEDPTALLQELIASFQAREALKRFPAQTGALREGQLEQREELDLLNKIVQQKVRLERQSRDGVSDPTDG